MTRRTIIESAEPKRRAARLSKARRSQVKEGLVVLRNRNATPHAPPRIVSQDDLASSSRTTNDRNPSHSEDAERALRDRRVQRRRDPECKDAPRVERVDDPVVPQPRR